MRSQKSEACPERSRRVRSQKCNSKVKVEPFVCHSERAQATEESEGLLPKAIFFERGTFDTSTSLSAGVPSREAHLAVCQRVLGFFQMGVASISPARKSRSNTQPRSSSSATFFAKASRVKKATDDTMPASASVNPHLKEPLAAEPSFILRVRQQPPKLNFFDLLFNNESGMTLVELMVVVVLIGIVSGGLLALLIDSQKLFAVSQQFAEAQDHARIAMNRACKDIRQSERMVMTGQYEIRFRQFFDDENRLKIIGYRLNSGSTNLERYIDNTPFDLNPGTYTPVASYIQNRNIGPTPVFSYHMPTSIGITLLVDPDTSKSPSYLRLNSSVEPRNQSRQEW